MVRRKHYRPKYGTYPFISTGVMHEDWRSTYATLKDLWLARHRGRENGNATFRGGIGFNTAVDLIACFRRAEV